MNQKIHDTLTADGWRCHDGPRLMHSECYYYKRFKTPSQCLCNSDKEGMQVVICYYTGYKGRFPSFEIEVTGEYQDGLWCKLQSYGITEDQLLLVLPVTIKKLLAAWEAMAGGTK